MNENKKLYFYVALVVLFIVLSLWYIFSTSVHNNGGAADDIRSELRRAGKSIESAIERTESIETGLKRSEEAINHSQSAIGESEKRVDSIQERAATLEKGLAELSDRIAGSKQIIKGIREAGKANKEKID